MKMLCVAKRGQYKEEEKWKRSEEVEEQRWYIARQPLVRPAEGISRCHQPRDGDEMK